MLFLDQNKPLSTCDAENCDKCPVRDKLHCHFTARDLIHFLTVILPGILLGGAGIYNVGIWHLILWLIIIFAFFGFVEIRILCAHCPHYAETGKTLKCWANYGSPKLWKYHPGPMSKWDKIQFILGALIWTGYPFPFLLLGGEYLLSVITATALISGVYILRQLVCSRCIHFSCPMNAVPRLLVDAYLQQNPRIREAWKESGYHLEET